MNAPKVILRVEFSPFDYSNKNQMRNASRCPIPTLASNVKHSV